MVQVFPVLVCLASSRNQFKYVVLSVFKLYAGNKNKEIKSLKAMMIALVIVHEANQRAEKNETTYSEYSHLIRNKMTVAPAK